MLTYFPAPYPDEWWYSVLCRFYVRSGIPNHFLVREILLGNGRSRIGEFIPNGRIASVTGSLPEGLIDTEDIILNHTPFRYMTRFFDEDSQKAIMESLKRGNASGLKNTYRIRGTEKWVPRYCPICMKEDRQSYGEAYYHLTHQLFMSSVCTKHHCRLKEIIISGKDPRMTLREHFIPLEIYGDAAYSDEDLSFPEYESVISDIAASYQRLPLSYRKRYTHNNLYQRLLNRGYTKICSRGIRIETGRLYNDLTHYYDEKLVRRVFGESISQSAMTNIEHFSTVLPDRYILLQGFMGMSTQEMLSEEKEPDMLRERIEEELKSEKLTTIKDLASRFHMDESSVKKAILDYGVGRFWQDRSGFLWDNAEKRKVTCSLSEEEFLRIRQEADRMGFRGPADYMISCTRWAMEKG